MRRITVWSFIGSVWTAWCLFIAVYVMIPDAPWDYPFWEGLMRDPTCFYHELWVIVGTWLAGLALLLTVRFVMAISAFLETIERVLVLPDGRLAIVRKKRLKPPNLVG